MEGRLSFDQLVENIRKWADDKSLLKEENAPKQIMKVVEEFGETCSAINKKNLFDVADGLGDTIVTLIILSYQLGFEPRDVLEIAWNEIRNRTGRTENGVFIKD